MGLISEISCEIIIFGANIYGGEFFLLSVWLIENEDCLCAWKIELFVSVYHNNRIILE